MNWSGGKDSSLALYEVLKSKTRQVKGLLTTVNEAYNRVSMHGLRVDLLDAQAKSIGLPLHKIYLPKECPMEVYNQRMKEGMANIEKQGITQSVFGDIFLEDLRKYREEKLQEIAFEGVFPIWKKDTTQLIYDFEKLGFRAVIICVNAKKLDESFLGRELNTDLLHDLPPDVDPCGENGEYHSFVFDGPIFNTPISFYKGEIVTKTFGKEDNEAFDHKFHYLDILIK